LSRIGWRADMGNDFGLFGKIYEKDELICREGDPGDEM
jgi:hypothetical protein